MKRTRAYLCKMQLDTRETSALSQSITIQEIVKEGGNGSNDGRFTECRQPLWKLRQGDFSLISSPSSDKANHVMELHAETFR